MRKKQISKIYDEAVYTFGKFSQLIKVAEELNELSAELLHSIHGSVLSPDIEISVDLIDEIADVEIMMVQLIDHILENRAQVEERKEVKIKRLESLIKKYREKKHVLF